jgi:hypothetical protein
MNRGLIKAAIILSYITAILWIFTIIGIPFTIFNFKAGGKLEKYIEGDKTVTKESATGWSVYLFFGAGILTGLLAILGVNLDSEPTFSNNSNNSRSLEEQLLELNRLYDQNLISKEEYELRREKIIQS